MSRLAWRPRHVGGPASPVRACAGCATSFWRGCHRSVSRRFSIVLSGESSSKQGIGRVGSQGHRRADGGITPSSFEWNGGQPERIALGEVDTAVFAGLPGGGSTETLTGRPFRSSAIHRPTHQRGAHPLDRALRAERKIVCPAATRSRRIQRVPPETVLRLGEVHTPPSGDDDDGRPASSRADERDAPTRDAFRWRRARNRRPSRDHAG